MQATWLHKPKLFLSDSPSNGSVTREHARRSMAKEPTRAAVSRLNEVERPSGTVPAILITSLRVTDNAAVSSSI